MPPKKRAKVSINDRVRADAVKAIGPARFHYKFGPQAGKKMLEGTVTGMVGQGRGRKWRVHWDTDDITTMTPHSLQVISAAGAHSHMAPQLQPVATSLAIQGSAPQATLDPTTTTPHPASSGFLDSIGHTTPSSTRAAVTTTSSVPQPPCSQVHSPPSLPTASSPVTTPTAPSPASNATPALSSAPPVQPVPSTSPGPLMTLPIPASASPQSQEEMDHLADPESTVTHGVKWGRHHGLLMSELPPKGSLQVYSNFILSGSDNILQHFYAAFPVTLLDLFVAGTNVNLGRREQRLTSRGELLRVIGAMVAIAEHARSSHVRSFFRRRSPDSYERSDRQEVFGLDGSRMEMILSYLAVIGDDEADDRARTEGGVGENDPLEAGSLQSVEPAFEAFNKAREDLNLSPGRHLCVDENMSAYVTKLHLPDLRVIERKPQPVGFEIKTLVDVSSGVMLAMELQRPPEAMAQRDYSQMKRQARWVLRLTRRFKGQGTVVFGDAAVASVEAAYEAKMSGIDFVGNVKQAHRRFPKAWLEQHIHEAPGSTYTATATVNLQGERLGVADPEGAVTLIAHAWRGDAQHPYTMLATCGSNAIGSPMKRGGKNVSQSVIAQAYNEAKSAVDLHNQIRQGFLALEEVYTAKKTTRRVLTTLIGICVTDTFLLRKAVFDQKQPFNTFLEELALALANNDIDSDLPGTRSQSTTSNPMSPATRSRSYSNLHCFENLSGHPRYAGTTKYPRLYCRVCGMKTAYYCLTCSSPMDIVPVCIKKRPGKPVCIQVHSAETNEVEQ